MPAERTLDLRGEICPDPLIQVQEAVGRAGAGDTFVVTVDYALAVENIARWTERQGYPTAVEPRGGEWEIRFRLP